MDTGKATFFGLMLIVLSIVGTAESRDKDGGYSIRGPTTCGEYLDAYSKSTLTGDSTYKGQYEFWNATGFINGYISSYNAYTSNGKTDVLAGMSNNDTYRWIASWCRDNPSKYVDHGVRVLIRKFNPVVKMLPDGCCSSIWKQRRSNLR